MKPQNKLLKRCEDNFNEETQKFANEIPEEILDCIIEVMQEWWPSFENEACNDFINDFIYDFVHDTVFNSKYGTILKIHIMNNFDEFIAMFKQDLFS